MNTNRKTDKDKREEKSKTRNGNKLVTEQQIFGKQ